MSHGNVVRKVSYSRGLSAPRIALYCRRCRKQATSCIRIPSNSSTAPTLVALAIFKKGNGAPILRPPAGCHRLPIHMDEKTAVSGPHGPMEAAASADVAGTMENSCSCTISATMACLKEIEFDPFNAGNPMGIREETEVNSFFYGIRGSNQRLPNENTLITESDSGRAFEVTPDKKIVSGVQQVPRVPVSAMSWLRPSVKVIRLPPRLPDRMAQATPTTDGGTEHETAGSLVSLKSSERQPRGETVAGLIRPRKTAPFSNWRTSRTAFQTADRYSAALIELSRGTSLRPNSCPSERLRANLIENRNNRKPAGTSIGSSAFSTTGRVERPATSK